MTLFPAAFKKATESAIMRKFSSGGQRRMFSAWKAEHLPKIQTVGAPHAASRARPESCSAPVFFLQVLPKAASLSLRTSAKKAASLGLEAGFPASTKSMPSASSVRRTARLSSREKLTFLP